MPAIASTVLVVDDEPGIRALVAGELAGIGLTVVLCTNGWDALKHIERNDFDLVVTDVRMPGASGIEVLRAAKSRALRTEVIVITGYTEATEADACSKGGAFAILRKPFMLADLRSSVRRALDHRAKVRRGHRA